MPSKNKRRLDDSNKKLSKKAKKASKNSDKESSSDSEILNDDLSEEGADLNLQRPLLTDAGDERVINVDFEFYDPTDDDFWAVKNFIKNYLDTTEFNSSELVDIIVGQKRVGTIIKADESVIGFSTVLCYQVHKNKECLKQIVEFILNHAPSDAIRQSLMSTLKCRLGLIICQRMINAPPQLASPAINGLFDEVFWATEDEPTKVEKDNFKFERYIILTNGYKDANDPNEHRNNRSDNKRKKKKLKDVIPMGIAYPRIEDEILTSPDICEFSFSFASAQPVDGTVTRLDGAVPWRTVAVFSADQVEKIRKLVKACGV